VSPERSGATRRARRAHARVDAPPAGTAPTRTPAGPERLTRLDAIVALLLALAVLTGGALRLVPGVSGVFHDDAIYALTAKALATGEGYRLLNLPGAPPQTKYPILYPAVLALVWRLVPTLPARLAAMQALTLALAAAAVAAAYSYVVRFRYAARLEAFAAGLLCASASNVLYYSTQILSEMPFALLLVAALWAAETYLRSETVGARRAALTGVALGLPFLCRTVGVVVPLVAVALMAMRRRPVLFVLAGVAIIVLPWIVWVAVVLSGVPRDPILAYQTDYLGWLSWTGLLFDGEVARANVLEAWLAFPQIAFEGIAHAMYARSDATETLLMVAGALPWLVLAARAWRRELLPLTLVVYLGLVCLWPWPPDRFLVPVLFFVASAAFALIRRSFDRLLPSGVGVAVVIAVLTGAVASNAVVLWSYGRVSRDSQYPYFMLPDAPVAWSSYRQAFTWLREHGAAGDVIAAGFDSMTALYTERPTIRPFAVRPRSLYYGDPSPPLGSVGDFDHALTHQRPRFLFVSPMPAFAEEAAFYELVARYRESHPRRLVPAYRGADPRFVVYEIAWGDDGGA
jgi:hypothetical protein